MLNIENLSVQLGQKTFRYTFQALPDSVTSIMGKSGSGKSTLLNLVSGFLEPASGTLEWNGESLLHLPPDQRPVTTLFQHNNLFPHLTVHQNIGLGIKPDLKLTSADEKRITEVLDEVGLAGFSHKVPKALSGGEQQRVALARCLLRHQPILLLDEPFSALDSATRMEMLELTRDIIHNNDLCAVLVTHNEADATALHAHQFRIENGVLTPA